MKLHTEDYLKTFSFRCLVENYLPPVSNVQIISTVDQRKTENSQLWIAGCSISHGIGINDCDRYGCLLSNKLNLPVSFLTFSSSSITWAADQILRSDIRSCDIVVWGLTSDFRVPYFINNNITHVNSSTYEFEKIVSLEELSSENTLYRNLTSVFQVSNFCSKVGATLVIASLLDNSIISHLRDSDNLIVLSNLWGRESNDRFLDLGHDQSHPGAQTHQFYADEIYQKISNLLTKLSNSSKI